jgi:hypothetical protein
MFDSAKKSICSRTPKHHRIGAFPRPGVVGPVHMSNWLAFSLSVVLLATADVPGAERLRTPANSIDSFASEDNISISPPYAAIGNAGSAQSAPNTAAKSTVLSEESKLQLIRYVSGEFAKALKPMPSGKDGFLFNVGKPIDENLLTRAVAMHGAAVNTGDQVQITKLDFRGRSIAVDVNGGGKPKKNWRDHIQIGMGGTMPQVNSQTTAQQENGPPGVRPGMGSTLILEFDKSIPDMTPEDLKKLLTPFMDFSRQRSAAVHWVDTLSPELKKAIQDRRPTVGMDREEVVAAIGKPEHKVRERDSDGNDIEDWIYGQPPSKTVFIRFRGDKVTSIRQYPQ